MLSKKMLSVWALSAVLSVPVFAQQKSEGMAGVPTLGKDSKGKLIVPKTLDDVPAAWCPSSNPKGWDHINQIDKGWTGFACSQNFLSISGDNITLGLFDKAYSNNTAAPGAKNLAYDFFRALIDTQINQGVDSSAAWGTLNKISQELHGKNVTGNPEASLKHYQDTYDDPAAALMFDTINRCGCVMQMTYDTSSTDPDKYLSQNGQLQNGCQGATQICGEVSPNLKSGTWGPDNQYNKSFQDLAKTCIYWWNTLVNNTYNKKNGVTDPNDANYTQICDPMMGGECTICTVSTALKNNYSNLPDRLFCDGSTFVGPGLISYSGKDRNGNMIQNPILVSFDGNTCGDNTGKVDIVAQ